MFKPRTTRIKELIVIINDLSLGGTERHIATILPYLVAKNWAVRIIVLNKCSILGDELKDAGVVVTKLYTEERQKKMLKFPIILRRVLGAIGNIIAIRRILIDNPNAIVHFFLPESYMLGMIAAFLGRHQGPKVMSRRSLNNYQKKFFAAGVLEKILFSKTNLICGNSKAIVSQLLNEGVPAEKLQLIYNGVNQAPFNQVINRTTLRGNLKINHDSFVMIMLANLIYYKGHKDLLNSLAEVKHLLPVDWKLVCVGRDDGIGNTLKEISYDLGLSNHVLWLGSRHDISNLLMISDLGILPSHQEGFSNAILEGMAAGLPMVVTNVGGNPEAVIHGETGLVVDPKQPRLLGSAIVELASNPEKAKLMGARGKQRVKEVFSLEACYNSYITLYDKCLMLKE